MRSKAKSILDLLSYPRALLYIPFGLLLTFAMSFLVLFLALVIRSRKVLDWAIIWLWSMPLIWPVGIRVEVRGGENVRKNGQGFLYVFNHSSLIDIPIMYAYLPRMFRFGAKVELFKIPIFGHAIRAAGILPIDRANRGKVMKVYDEAIQRIQNGECFALAPEGTRQDAAELGRFKRGPFEFAVNAKMDIVPVVLAGALDVLPKYSLWMNGGRWRRTIIVQILPPVLASQYTVENSEALQDLVRSQMAPYFVQLNAELKGF